MVEKEEKGQKKKKRLILENRVKNEKGAFIRVSTYIRDLLIKHVKSETLKIGCFD